MTTWKDFAAAEPELADRARSLLTCTLNGVLGTIRADGSPRLSGIDPFFFDDEPWIGSMPGARKGDDLKRDARMVLHGIPWESRRVRDGVDDAGEADVKVTGRAVHVTDPDTHAAVTGWIREEQGMESPGPSDLFRIDLDTVVVISVAEDQLVIDRWSAADGRSTVRRS